MSGEAGAPSNTTPSSRGKREQGWRQRLKDWMGENSLFITITIWVGLAIFAFLLVASLLGHTPIWNLKLTDQESIVKTALTLVGGVGAVAYLVIKYQERQQAKRDEERASREGTREKDRLINTKMQDAVNQLGSDKVSTRIAGVYALTDIADTYRGGYRQRVVDILCGYLRSDRTSYALDEFGNTVKDEFGRLVKSGSSDKAVESTILDMFAVHLRKERRSRENEVTVRQQVEDDQLWCDCRFDFHGTAFHGVVSFAYSMFENETDFSDVTFEGTADFSNATFEGTADFSDATFNRKYRNATYFFYKWGPISIPPDNDGLPAGAKWAELQEERAGND